MLVKYHRLKLANRLEENALNDTDFTASLLPRSLKLEYTRVVECGPVPQGGNFKTIRRPFSKTSTLFRPGLCISVEMQTFSTHIKNNNMNIHSKCCHCAFKHDTDCTSCNTKKYKNCGCFKLINSGMHLCGYKYFARDTETREMKCS